ncbi:MAG: leucine-rich repeat domain-containing protein [Candidatus Stahlbacteria bacterium]|nr:MAG: leucine-rich repeat domain-containing protein [Candidatus Stahlbacteria bacterium]
MKKVCFLLVIAIFIVLIINLSAAFAQWPPYSGSLFNTTSSFFNSQYENSFSPVFSSFSGLGFRGLENYGNYATGGFNNSYTYGNFGNFSPSIFSPFSGSFTGGPYGGPSGGLYTGLTNYNTFSPGIFSPLSSNVYMNPLQWNTPSFFPGSIYTANNNWTGMSNIWSMPFPGGQYPYNPYSSPYPRTASGGLTIIRTDTDGLLEERIRDELGLGSNVTITTAKALSLTSLDANDMCFEQSILISPPGVYIDGGPNHEIKCEPHIDISILEDFTNLTELDLRRNTIDDISPLAELTNLEKLILHTTNTKDIAALEGLTKLIELDIHKTKVSDISPLAELTNLEILKLHSSKIEDISPLENLTNLEELILDNNQISDISPLDGLVNLKKLLLGNNEISDISPLLSLNNLEHLELRGNRLDNGDCPIIEELRSRGASVKISTSDNLECK